MSAANDAEAIKVNTATTAAAMTVVVISVKRFFRSESATEAENSTHRRDRSPTLTATSLICNSCWRESWLDFGLPLERGVLLELVQLFQRHQPVFLQLPAQDVLQCPDLLASATCLNLLQDDSGVLNCSQ